MKLLLYLLGALILMGLAVLVIDNNRFVIRKYKIRGSGVKKRGDLIISSTAGKSKNWIRHTASLMQGIGGICPMYYVDGNHEMRLRDPGYGLEDCYRELEKILKEAGALPLHNRKTLLKEYGISLFGLELDRDCYLRFRLKDLSLSDIEKKIGRADPECFNLLLTHNPDYFKVYALWGADAVLSGHVHGGIVRIPFTRQGVINPCFRLFPRYSGGRYETEAGEGKHHASMILSCGLGMHTLPVRAFNPAELSVIDIVPES